MAATALVLRCPRLDCVIAVQQLEASAAEDDIVAGQAAALAPATTMVPGFTRIQPTDRMGHSA